MFVIRICPIIEQSPDTLGVVQARQTGDCVLHEQNMGGGTLAKQY